MRIHSLHQQLSYQALQRRDWSTHSLGPMQSWDPLLIQTLNIIFNSPQPSLVFWGPEAICFYNDGIIPILGESKHPHALGEKGEKVWEENWYKITKSQFESAMAGESFWRSDLLIPVRRNGMIKDAYFTYSCSPLLDESGKVKGVLTTALETTSNVQMRERSDKTVDQMGLALEMMAVGFYDWDIPSDRIVFNTQMQNDWGISAGSTLADVFESIHPEDRERVKATIDAAVVEKKRYLCTYRIQTEGGIEWIEARGTISFQGDRPVRFFGTSRVVTELVETRNSLSREQKKFKAIFESAPAALAYWQGEDLTFENINLRYQEIFPGRELIGKPLLEAVPELKGQGFDELLLRVLRTGVPFTGKEVLALIPKSEGSLEEKYFDVSYVQITDSDGTPIGVFDHAVDVTRRVIANREIEAERQLRETVVQAVTHDLRTPLTAAKLSVELAIRAGDEEKRRTYLKRISSTMERADKMIQDLLDASLLKAGQDVPLVPQLLNLSELSESILIYMQPLFGESLHFNIQRDVSTRVDREAYIRILENLLSNANKYRAKGTPVKVDLTQDESSTFIKVNNSGNPIPSQDLMKIFEVHYRSEAAKKSTKGWGIGLTLTKALVEAHGGEVSVTSDAPSGTTFTVRLPY